MNQLSPPRPNTFAGLSLSLDRAAERREDDAWIDALSQRADARCLLLDARGQAFLHADRDGLRWLNPGERRHWFGDSGASFLGIAADQPYFMRQLHDDARDEAIETALHARRASLRAAALQLPADQAGLFAYAKGLAHWQHETRHCARCGAPLRLVAAGHRARCTREACGRLHFPRTDAAVIMLVEHDGACLLGRQAGWPPGRYSTLAGFVEPGESLEDAVRREVAEESGVLVDHVQYHSSQPWPMPASLMVGFIAQASSPTILRRDQELEDVRWFRPEHIASGLADGSFLPSPPLSVSYQLLAWWLEHCGDLDLDALVANAAPP